MSLIVDQKLKRNPSEKESDTLTNQTNEIVKALLKSKVCSNFHIL